MIKTANLNDALIDIAQESSIDNAITLLKNFLDSRNSHSLINELINNLERRERIIDGRSGITIKTPFNLTENQLEILAQSIPHSTDVNHSNIRQKITPELIGGATVSSSDYQINVSLSHSLKKLRLELL